MLSAAAIAWCEAHHQETLDLLRTLGRIPAPSHNEDRRVEFVKNWLEAQGARGVYVDGAKNVILPLGVTENNDLTVIMAHMDIVFPDTEPLAMREENGNLYAPGIGDDTANLVNLMMCAKYIIENRLAPKNGGVLIVANSCEEGLGNLKGSKQIVGTFGSRIKEFISFDGYMGDICDNAVGSCRMRITVKAQGGHSYFNYGNTNAIAQMAEIITALYSKPSPTKAKTTYNAGVIGGGTTVNSICGECSLLYEYRSEDASCLKEMEDFVADTLDAARARGVNVSMEVLGLRPCKGDVDAAKQAALENRAKELMVRWHGGEPRFYAMSTDANTSLAAGIPSVVFGTVDGALCHTRNEWVNLASMLPGSKVALDSVLAYFGV